VTDSLRCPRHPNSRFVRMTASGLYCAACGRVVRPTSEPEITVAISEADIDVDWDDAPERVDIHNRPTPRAPIPLPHRLPPDMADTPPRTPVVTEDLAPAECPMCGASGSVDGDVCPLCGGQREVLGAAAAAFRIPPIRVPKF
jgi:hypothetical protein